MKNTKITIYRFHDKVAISSESGTIYLTKEEAEQAGVALIKNALDLYKKEFSESVLGNTEISA